MTGDWWFGLIAGVRHLPDLVVGRRSPPGSLDQALTSRGDGQCTLDRPLDDRLRIVRLFDNLES
jgi:hypothetical protein